MRKENEIESKSGVQGTVDLLIRAAEIDTVFRDVYLFRAKELVADWLDLRAYRILQREKATLAHLPDQIRLAMGQSNWQDVVELTGRMETLQNTLAEQHTLLSLGDQLYGTNNLPIDPFSPGLQGLAGVPTHALSGMRDQLLGLLRQLVVSDSSWQGFYAGRQEVFRKLSFAGTGEKIGKDESYGEAQLQEQAEEALRSQNFEGLKRLAQRLAGGGEKEAAGFEDDPMGRRVLNDFKMEFSPETVQHAGRLGLVRAHVDSWVERLGDICRYAHRYAWSPALAHNMESHNGAIRLPTAELPQNTPEGLKKRMELFVLHPMVNSGGARFLPVLTAEDFLVEDFEEPLPGGSLPDSELLTALELPRRNQLTRQRIEEALLQHGPRILERELRLDPRRFRLVCIPADLHLRFGLERGWGQQPVWTHFDGYLVMQDRHLRPLAGGDVRFGGIYDMVSIGHNYESDRVFVRFAVVCRERMCAW